MDVDVDVVFLAVVVVVVVVVDVGAFEVGPFAGKWCWSRSHSLGAFGGGIFMALSRSSSSWNSRSSSSWAQRRSRSRQSFYKNPVERSVIRATK